MKLKAPLLMILIGSISFLSLANQDDVKKLKMAFKELKQQRQDDQVLLDEMKQAIHMIIREDLRGPVLTTLRGDGSCAQPCGDLSSGKFGEDVKESDLICQNKNVDWVNLCNSEKNLENTRNEICNVGGPFGTQIVLTNSDPYEELCKKAMEIYKGRYFFGAVETQLANEDRVEIAD